MSMSNGIAPGDKEGGEQVADDLRRYFEEAQKLLAVGRADQALVPLRDILGIWPDHPDALNFASVAFGQLEMAEEAERCSRQAIAQRPDDAGFHLNLANRLNDQGRIDEALDVYDQALSRQPGHVPALKSRLRCLVATKRWREARAAVDPLLGHAEENAELLVECAEACIGAGDTTRAFDIYKEALVLEPDRIPWLLQFARLAMKHNQIELAKTTGEHVLELTEHAEMRSMLASIMHRIGDLEAMKKHLEAIPEGSDQAANAANLQGMMLVSQCRIREGLDHMARTDKLEPNSFQLQATRAMYLNYDPDLSTASLKDIHFAIGRRFADSLPLLDRLEPPERHDPDRRLRIGFVSPDLRRHSVAYFIRPYLRSFDQERFDVFAYAHVPKEDFMSEEMRRYVTAWHNVCDMSDQTLAERIRADCIDILIDLAGYTRDSRLPAFTARPAPIQMTYIGYPNTTGMPAIDYRITDSIADPEGADDHFSETLIRMPGCFLCYSPPDHAPSVEPGPYEHQGFITFGSFNNFAKVNPDVVNLWAKVLQAVPSSKLLLKSTSSSDGTAQKMLRERLESAGIAPYRVDFAAFRRTPESHLAVYNDIDIALDTFPYNGTTTTCEALWMGVPVITLRGDRHASRVGASLLTVSGFPAGIAETPEDYVMTAKLLAENPSLLKTARRTLRETVTGSTLCDGQRHAAMLERGFLAAWQIWCEKFN